MTASGSFEGPAFYFGHNVVGGDQINQSGQVNIGKVESGAGGKYDPAVEELRALVLDLKRYGIITPAGEVADERRLEAAVLERKPRLQKVARALAAGARSVLLGFVNSEATPAILQLIEKLVK
jgi:hypothetical protein